MTSARSWQRSAASADSVRIERALRPIASARFVHKMGSAGLFAIRLGLFAIPSEPRVYPLRRFLLCLTLLSTSLLAADPATNAATLEQLARQLDSERAATRDLRQQWESEAAQLDLLARLAADQQAELHRQQTRLREQVRTDRASIAALRAEHEDLHALGERLDGLAEHIRSRLDRLLATTLLGAHDALDQDDSRGRDPEAHAFSALANAEQSARAITTRITTGTLPGGERRAVEALVIGGAAGWWRAIDHTAAGTLTMDAGELRLQPIADPGLKKQIIDAFAVRAGKEQPRFLALPQSAPGATP